MYLFANMCLRAGKTLLLISLPISFLSSLFITTYLTQSGGRGSIVLVFIHIFGKIIHFFGANLDDAGHDGRDDYEDDVAGIDYSIINNNKNNTCKDNNNENIKNRSRNNSNMFDDNNDDDFNLSFEDGEVNLLHIPKYTSFIIYYLFIFYFINSFSNHLLIRILKIILRWIAILKI
jgi:hypothetical protein